MPAPSPLGISVKEALDAIPGISEHPSGHSENLLRYLAPSGAPFAVGRVEQKALRFWCLPNPALREGLSVAGIAIEESIPKSRGASGRNSNLDQITEFKRQPLVWARVSSPAEAATLLGLLVAATREIPCAGTVEIGAPDADIPAAPVTVPVETPAPAYEASAAQPAEPAPAPVALPADHATPTEAVASRAPVEPEPPVASPAMPAAPPEPTPPIPAPPPQHGLPPPRRPSLIRRIFGAVFGRRHRG